MVWHAQIIQNNKCAISLQHDKKEMSDAVFIFFKVVFTPCKAEQPLQGMELQEKEAQKG